MSSAQLDLLGLDTPPPFRPDALDASGRKPLGYTLFFAIFPEPQDAQRIANASAEVADQHALVQHRHAPERLHITLHTLGRFTDTLPQLMIDAAKTAAASVRCSAFPVVFDHELSFSHNDAFVLGCDRATDEAIGRLRQTLTIAMRRVELRSAPSLTPHMTLLYDSKHVAKRSIAPITWTAKRFILIVSHVGRHHHQGLGQWDFTGRLNVSAQRDATNLE